MEKDAAFASMQQPQHQFHGHRHSHRRRPRPIVELQPGHVAFRVVCHFSIVGGLIGASGSAISKIRRDSGCIVHCEEQVNGSDHRIITVVGPASCRERRLPLLYGGSGEAEGLEAELVSVAQEAVVMVCERMWEVDAQRGGFEKGGVSEGYCGLLANTSQIGVVVGRGGNNVVRMRKVSGAHIRVLPAPLCAAKDDELIQITGAILSVKKAVIAVTSCLQECPPSGKDPMLLTRPAERASSQRSSNPHAEFFPHLSLLLPPLTGKSVNSHSSSRNADCEPNQGIKQEVSFRLLCSNGAAGSIIGTKGAIVRALQNETGASIMFAASTNGSGERVVTISALEDTETWHSPAQNAVVLVFARSVEFEIEKGHLSGSIKGTSVTARLLVASDAVPCIHGKGGRIDSEMTEVTGADIQILEGDEVLGRGLKPDVVVQISGEYRSVQNALFQVTGRLREDLLHGELFSKIKDRNSHEVREMTYPGSHHSASSSLDADQECLARGMDRLGLSNNIGDHPPRLLSPQNLGRAITITAKESNPTGFRGGSELERSLHFLLPREVFNEVGAKSTGEARDTIAPGLQTTIGTYPVTSQETILTEGNDQLGVSYCKVGRLSRLKLPQSGDKGKAITFSDNGRGSTTNGGSVKLDRKKSAVVTNTTVELRVSEDILGSVYGEDGSNLSHLRQISGAKVEVRDPSPGRHEAMVLISGTPDQTRAAQSLLQAFMLNG